MPLSDEIMFGDSAIKTGQGKTKRIASKDGKLRNAEKQITRPHLQFESISSAEFHLTPECFVGLVPIAIGILILLYQDKRMKKFGYDYMLELTPQSISLFS